MADQAKTFATVRQFYLGKLYEVGADISHFEPGVLKAVVDRGDGSTSQPKG